MWDKEMAASKKSSCGEFAIWIQFVNGEGLGMGLYLPSIDNTDIA